MEKTTPERKVLLREQDVFYVYDKRINKCVKEDCDGTVKYGLVLKVNMPNGDTLNTFECNKCHMKYTAYPNYVRLASSEEITIYNQDEVTLRDQKRASDAARQEARAKKKELARKQYTAKKNGKPYGKKLYEKKTDEKKSYEKKPYDKKLNEKKPYEKKSYEKKPYERKSYEKGSYDKYREERHEEDGRRSFRQKDDRGGARNTYDYRGSSGGYQKRYHNNRNNHCATNKFKSE